MSNPFAIIGPRSAESAVRREDAKERVLYHIKRGEYVSVLAPPQTGKTTFLNIDLVPTLRDRYQVCRLDLQHAPSDFILHELARASVSQGLVGAPPPDKLDDRPSKGMSAIRHWLDDWASDRRQVVFLVDELPQDPEVTTYLLTNVRAYFNEALSQSDRPPHLFVFAGLDDLASLTARNRPYLSPFNIAYEVSLTDFTQDETRELIVRLTRADAKASVFDSDTIDRIFDLTLGHPYLVQLLCYKLYEAPAERDTLLASPEDAVTHCGIESSDNAQAMMGRLAQDEGLAKERALLADLVLGKRQLPFTATVPTHRTLQLQGCIRNGDGWCVVRNPIYEVVFHRFFEAERPSGPFAMEVRPFTGFLHVHVSEVDGSESDQTVPKENTPGGPRFRIDWGREYRLAVALVEWQEAASPSSLAPTPSASIPIEIPGTGRPDRTVKYYLRTESFRVDLTPSEHTVSVLRAGLAPPIPRYRDFHFFSPNPLSGGSVGAETSPHEDPERYTFSIFVRIFQGPAVVQVCELRFCLPEHESDCRI